MSDFLKNFLQAHAELSLLLDADKVDMDKMLWAHEKGYTRLTSAPTGELCYTAHDLEVSRMWWEKCNE